MNNAGVEGEMKPRPIKVGRFSSEAASVVAHLHLSAL